MLLLPNKKTPQRTRMTDTHPPYCFVTISVDQLIRMALKIARIDFNFITVRMKAKRKKNYTAIITNYHSENACNFHEKNFSTEKKENKETTADCL